MNIEVWHKILENNFENLRGQKQSHLNLFAIEHGLSKTQIDGLKDDVQQAIADRISMDNAWLPLVVYATEFGYEYEGDEYWRSFESNTPLWKENGKREWINKYFLKFIDRYNGYSPTGKWAKHFHIISLPILHSLLPKDFQKTLAKLINKLSHFFSASLIDDPKTLGRRISDFSENESRRFQRFADNHELTGLIVRELLTHQILGGENAILESAFQRIVSDLTSNLESKAWIDEAKERAKRPTRRGSKADLNPRMFLRPKSDNKWGVFVEIPDLAPFAIHDEEVEAFLQTSKTTLVGNISGSRLVKGALTNFGPTKYELKELPKTGKPLLEFVREPPRSLEKFLKKRMVLNLGEVPELFIVQSDGSAELAGTRRLKSGRDYILVSCEGLSEGVLKPLECTCKGIYLYSFSFEGAHADSIAEFDLQIDNGYNLVPTGLTPTDWNGGAHIEYVDGDRPVFAIETDHEWQKIRIKLDEYDEIDLNNSGNIDNVLFCLPALSTGLFKLEVSVQTSIPGEFEPLENLNILVKDAGTLVRGNSYKHPIRAIPNPVNASLEDLLDGCVDFDVLGHPTVVSVDFMTSDSAGAIGPHLRRKLKSTFRVPQELALLNESIKKSFEDEKLASIVENVNSLSLEFASDEFGSASVLLKRKFTPINWRVESANGQKILTLSEDMLNGLDKEFKIKRYRLETPDIPERLDILELPLEIGDEETGLYLAETESLTKGVVLLPKPPIRRLSSLDQLAPQQEFKIRLNKPYSGTRESLLELIDLYRCWNSAKHSGNPLSKYQVRQVLRTIRFKIAKVIVGIPLNQIEACGTDVKGLNDALLRSSVFATKIRQELVSMPLSVDSSTDEIVRRFHSILTGWVKETEVRRKRGQFTILKHLSKEFLVEFALRLAESPGTLESWCIYSDKYFKGLDTMLRLQNLMFAARYVVRRTELIEGFRWNW